MRDDSKARGVYAGGWIHFDVSCTMKEIRSFLCIGHNEVNYEFGSEEGRSSKKFGC